MEINNALSGVHIRSKKEDPVMKLHSKSFTWRIPEHLLDMNIQPGDIVAVGDMFAPVLVMKVFSLNIEATESHKSIRKLLVRAPQD